MYRGGEFDRVIQEVRRSTAEDLGVWDLKCRGVRCSARVQGSGFRVWGFGFPSGSGFTSSGSAERD